MFRQMKFIPGSLASTLIVTLGIILLLIISAWAYFNINYYKRHLLKDIMHDTDRFNNTIMLDTRYAMMLNSRSDINQIITNVAKQKEIETIRIYNREGKIKFSSSGSEINHTTNIKAEACIICHRTEPPVQHVRLPDRTRIFSSATGERLLGIISPIYNEPGCFSNACHMHSPKKKVLGLLDVVVSMKDLQDELFYFKKRILALAMFLFLIPSVFILFFILRFVNRPIKKLIAGTQRIAAGDYKTRLPMQNNHEIGQLSLAINRMGAAFYEKQAELNKQIDEYQNLFEGVPCIITVQDRNYKLVGYNREFSEKFAPAVVDYCYHAYKGRDSKCVVCPVEKTFQDGQSHTSEETGYSKDGKPTHWIVKTAPVKDAQGNIIAAMEMSLDITQSKLLEEELRISEKKYHAIFNNIPNPVFVLDTDTYEIIDCNDSVPPVYGYAKTELRGKSFLTLFPEEDRDRYAALIQSATVINQVKNLHSSGSALFVNIRISLSEYAAKKVFLVTTSDITQRIAAEQQLIQASRMATLGEMATGVAHELNQPLAVIKTASGFFMKKIKKEEEIKPEILFTLAEEIDSHVDRATRIIQHMREFGRKSDLSLEPVQINDVIERAFEIFHQQLALREIEVLWNLDPDLPAISADAGRLEQVFINLFINARDAIGERWNRHNLPKGAKKIMIETFRKETTVFVKVKDTGAGVPVAIGTKIFEPFFTTKKVGEGTGLGLSISYGIIKECGGNIQVESPNGEGACFTITFPIADVE